MRHETLLQPSTTLFLFIDLQEKLLPAMNNSAMVLQKNKILAQTAKILSLPVMVTEQYPQGLGATVGDLKNDLPATANFYEKRSFSAAGAENFISALKNTEVIQIVMAGIETHICVLQTALDLYARGYQVHIVSDACSSRSLDNHNVALSRLQNAGVIISHTESVLFELLKTAENPAFKNISKMIK